MSAYRPDVSLKMKTEKGLVTVHLAEGDQFPVAVHNGRVITGPPDGSLTSDGVPLHSLKWSYPPFWVIEALSEKNEAVELTPDQYFSAVEEAKRA